MAIRLALSDRTLVEEAVYEIAWLRAYGLGSGMLDSLGASTWPYILCIRSSSSSSWLWCRCKCLKSTNLDTVSRQPHFGPLHKFVVDFVSSDTCTCTIHTHVYLLRM
jgi:hypothetical protein